MCCVVNKGILVVILCKEASFRDEEKRKFVQVLEEFLSGKTNFSYIKEKIIL
jgi:hypothetical protein